MTAKLTDKVVKGATPPKSGQLFIRDSEVKGFALRVMASGAKSFVFEARIRGRNRRLTIGPYPGVSVDAARKKATAHRGAVVDGRDPAEERSAERTEPTFADAADRFLTDYARP